MPYQPFETFSKRDKSVKIQEGLEDTHVQI
jgi:hypothetical protein